VNQYSTDRETTRTAARRWRLPISICAAVAALAFADVAPAQEQHVQIGASQKSASIRLTGGKSETVRTDRTFADVIVSDPEIADVVPLTDRSLSILGKKIGTTRVSIYAGDKALVGVFDIEVTHDTSVLGTELRERFPDARLRVASVNGRILLSGTAPDAVTVDTAVSIAKHFGSEVINSVRVLQPQQVMLEVRFIEASRTAGRELGINWNVVGRNASAATGAFVGGGGLAAVPIALASGNTPFGLALGRIVGNGVEVDAMINALEGKGLVRRLAEPNLIALSGDTASFLAGGEFPIPVASSRDTVTVEWKRYGVGLAFTPTVLQSGVINLKIEPEVSQLDPGNVIQIGGLRLPSLTVRRANTTIELRDGQSFAIAGLLQSIDTSDQKQFPWLGNVPVIGALLRSTQYQKQETDLAIIVTPHLVRPTRPGEELKSPLDNTVAGNDADLFLNGRAELTPRQLGDAVPAARPIKPIGHILDLPNGAS
jgi:pilus assembly protein CpaC